MALVPPTSVGGGGGSLALIQTVSGAGATLDFTGIANTYQHLWLIVEGRSDTAATSTNLLMRFNGDTSAIYDWERYDAGAATVSAGESIAATSLMVGEITGATATASRPGLCEILIPNYAETSFFKSFRSGGGFTPTATSGNIVYRGNFGLWRSTVAITQVTFLPLAGSFIAGSRASLYGLS